MREEHLERMRKLFQLLFGTHREGMLTLDECDEDLTMLQAEICENVYLLTGEEAGMTVVRDTNYFLNYAKLIYLEAGFRMGALMAKKSDAEINDLFRLAEESLFDGNNRSPEQGKILNPPPHS